MFMAGLLLSLAGIQLGSALLIFAGLAISFDAVID